MSQHIVKHIFALDFVEIKGHIDIFVCFGSVFSMGMPSEGNTAGEHTRRIFIKLGCFFISKFTAIVSVNKLILKGLNLNVDRAVAIHYVTEFSKLSTKICACQKKSVPLRGKGRLMN